MTTPNAKPSGKTAQSQEQHTKGPWKIGYSDGSGMGEDGEGPYILDAAEQPMVWGGKDDWGCVKGARDIATARRIVACVNYCEGVDTPELEHAPASMNLQQLLRFIDNDVQLETIMFAKVQGERDALAAQNIELVKALLSMTNGLADHLKAGTVLCDSCAADVEQARALLAKLKP